MCIRDRVYAPAFTNYVEGIYVGYKYYETAVQEGAIDYDKTVQYPFEMCIRDSLLVSLLEGKITVIQISRNNEIMYRYYEADFINVHISC